MFSVHRNVCNACNAMYATTQRNARIDTASLCVSAVVLLHQLRGLHLMCLLRSFLRLLRAVHLIEIRRLVLLLTLGLDIRADP